MLVIPDPRAYGPLTAYDLEAPDKVLYPILTPLRLGDIPISYAAGIQRFWLPADGEARAWEAADPDGGIQRRPHDRPLKVRRLHKAKGYPFSLDRDATVAALRDMADQIEAGKILPQKATLLAEGSFDDFMMQTLIIEFAQMGGPRRRPGGAGFALRLRRRRAR